MAYDVRCFELAEYFLEDEPKLKSRTGELAQLIQHTIEDWIACERPQAGDC